MVRRSRGRALQVSPTCPRPARPWGRRPAGCRWACRSSGRFLKTARPLLSVKWLGRWWAAERSVASGPFSTELGAPRMVYLFLRSHNSRGGDVSVVHGSAHGAGNPVSIGRAPPCGDKGRLGGDQTAKPCLFKSTVVIRFIPHDFLLTATAASRPTQRSC